ncbi:S-adenosyl-L-methionine-dependent methyltransferase [Aspergillus stella-maris]|uniref:S-adenosyl-L-methionine-dependent methyltransferase n=1 Tax=Aspergillus stella-maris TaxID=1810926 RepID=UPI003CCD027B
MSLKSPSKGRLISHFEAHLTPSHGKAWSDLWDLGESDLWDRGIPSPALLDLIVSRQDMFSPWRVTNAVGVNVPAMVRKRALVPGCGRGYDVVALALHGFDAYGLEISSTAVSEARSYAEEQVKAPSAYNYAGTEYGLEAQSALVAGSSGGKARFVQGDFFEETWLEATHEGMGSGTGRDDIGNSGKFDLIYDYTFLCALHPSRRSDWAERMAELLWPGGFLVCLEFPMYKDPDAPGPPWGVNGVHLELLNGGKENGGGGKFLRKVYYKPEKTYKVGEGTDMISVYERKRDV